MSIQGIAGNKIHPSMTANDGIKPNVVAAKQKLEEKETSSIKPVSNEDTNNAKNLTKDTEKQKQNLADAVEELKQMVRIFDRKLDFSIHEDTHRVMVKVMDSETDKVIREVPPEELLDLVAKMKETFSLFVDVRV